MTTRYKNAFRNELLAYIEKSPGVVVLRRELNNLGSPRQVSRALNDLLVDGQIVRIGHGIYAKAEPSEYLDRPVIRSGFTEACIEALNRLGVDWELSQSAKDYNEGKSQQVPARFEVRLKSRFRRKIEYGNRALRIEGMTHAR